MSMVSHINGNIMGDITIISFLSSFYFLPYRIVEFEYGLTSFCSIFDILLQQLCSSYFIYFSLSLSVQELFYYESFKIVLFSYYIKCYLRGGGHHIVFNIRFFCHVYWDYTFISYPNCPSEVSKQSVAHLEENCKFFF